MFEALPCLALNGSKFNLGINPEITTNILTWLPTRNWIVENKVYLNGDTLYVRYDLLSKTECESYNESLEQRLDGIIHWYNMTSFDSIGESGVLMVNEEVFGYVQKIDEEVINYAYTCQGNRVFEIIYKGAQRDIINTIKLNQCAPLSINLEGQKRERNVSLPCGIDLELFGEPVLLNIDTALTDNTGTQPVRFFFREESNLYVLKIEYENIETSFDFNKVAEEKILKHFSELYPNSSLVINLEDVGNYEFYVLTGEGLEIYFGCINNHPISLEFGLLSIENPVRNILGYN